MQKVRRSQNNRNAGTCWAKGLTGFKLYATSASLVVPCKRTQQVTTLLGSTMFGVVGQQPDELLVRVYKGHEYNRVESLVVEVLGTTLWRTLVGNVLPFTSRAQSGRKRNRAQSSGGEGEACDRASKCERSEAPGVLDRI